MSLFRGMKFKKMSPSLTGKVLKVSFFLDFETIIGLQVSSLPNFFQPSRVHLGKLSSKYLMAYFFSL